MSSQALAQCPSYIFHGTLIIPTRNYPSIIEVQLLSNQSEQPLAYAYTDATNRFRFDNMQANRFDVVVRLEHFKELRESVDIGDSVIPTGGTCDQSRVFWLIPEESTDEP